ncbi:MAG TPA: PhnD/SsuA/transferrin family substrate-binding protein [Polyangiaceae bacterium]|jgi:ABC-type phosphate/phosphonate transport system substrate-binding protein
MSTSYVRFAMATTPQIGDAAVRELRDIFGREHIEVEPVWTRDYGALYDAVHLHEADVAWAPPLVARDLRRDGAAEPCAAVVRKGGLHYFSAIVGTESLSSPKEIQRFGWVSRLSAAGYLVPRGYLTSIGVSVDFREERFFRTHQRSMAALAAGIVDAIATFAVQEHAGETPIVPHAFDGARVLATIGPIPGDVIVVSSTMPRETASRVGALVREAKLSETSAIAELMGAEGFGAVPPGHLEALGRWVAGSVFSRPRAAEER